MTTDDAVLVDRLFARISWPAVFTACWPWKAYVSNNGYGIFKAWSGRKTYAHRASYELLIGPIPDGLQIDHLCRVRNCVNPTHLEPVTQKENNRRGESRSAINARKTACNAGHPYGQGINQGRSCRVCKRERDARYLSEKREALLIPMDGLTSATTYTGRIRHLAKPESLAPEPDGIGRGGAPICDSTAMTSVHDQESFDADRLRWNSAYVSKPIAGLPLCKRCAKKVRGES